MVVEQETQSILDQGYGKTVTGASGEADGAKPKGMDLSPLIRVIRRNLPMILGMAILAATAGAILGAKAKPSYQGGFRILVEPITSQGRSTDPSAISRGAQSAENMVDYPTLLQVLQSPGLLGQIAKQIQTRYPDVTTESLEGDIRTKSLIVQRVGTNLLDSARLIDVSYRGQDAEKVRFILEELSKGFLRYSLEERRSRIGGGVEFIEDQLPRLQERVGSLSLQLQVLMQRYGVTDTEEEGTSLSNQLEAIRGQSLQTNRDLAEQDTLYNRLQEQLGLTPIEAIAASALAENPRYQELLSELKKLEAQIAVKSGRYTDKSPVVNALLEQRNNLAQLLSSEAQRNLGDQSEVAANKPQILQYQGSVRQGLISQLVAANNTRQILQVRAQAIAEAETDLNVRLQQHPVLVREYHDLQQQLQIANTTLNQFLTQRETLRIEAAQKEVPWEVISAPDLERDLLGKPRPTASKSPPRVPIAFVMGLLLGVVVSLIRDKVQNIFHGAEDVVSATKLPLLGNIPRQGLPAIAGASMLNGGASSRLVTLGEEPFHKAFSSLYTNLRFLSSHAPKSLVINSAEVGDGKTTVAVNLALVVASMGQRVLLVEADLRSPQLHNLLNLSPHGKGLGDVLAGAVPVETAIQTSDLSQNLSVLTAGQAAAESVRLLASTQMQSLMQQFHQDFDLVIYDTPHLTEFADANFIAALTDGILMVVGLRKTKRPRLKQVMDELKRFRLNVVGVIANDVGNQVAKPTKPWTSLQKRPGDPALLESLNVLKPRSSTHV